MINFTVYVNQTSYQYFIKKWVPVSFFNRTRRHCLDMHNRTTCVMSVDLLNYRVELIISFAWWFPLISLVPRLRNCWPFCIFFYSSILSPLLLYVILEFGTKTKVITLFTNSCPHNELEKFTNNCQLRSQDKNNYYFCICP